MRLELKCFECNKEIVFTEEDVNAGKYILCDECLKLMKGSKKSGKKKRK